jgi:hypothetical protein
MSQAAVPISDDYSTGWAPTPITPVISELIPLDNQWVTASSGVFMVKLAPMSQPGPGTQQILLHLQQSTANAQNVAVILYQGTSTPVATRSFTPGTSFSQFTVTLTTEEQALITDYTNLHLQVSVVTTCATGLMPTTLYATLHDEDHCPCAAGTIALNWNGFAWSGTGPFGNCPHEITLTLTPNGTNCESWSLVVSFTDNCDGGTTVPSGYSCDCATQVFSWGVIWPSSGHCGCSGTPTAWTITITI